jgi:arylsulfatase A-like enzyme
MLGDHGRLQKSSWHEQALVVPTAIRHPDHLRGALCAAPVEITDLSATILDIAGIDPSAALSKPWPAFHDRVPCRSLMPVVRGESDSVREFSFSECSGNDAHLDHHLPGLARFQELEQPLWQAIRDARWKYIRHLQYAAPGAVREELYDLRSDPHETRNLAAGAPTADARADAAAVLTLMRERREWVEDSTPPAQLRWAPLPPEGERFSYPDAAAAFDPPRPR